MRKQSQIDRERAVQAFQRQAEKDEAFLQLTLPVATVYFIGSSPKSVISFPRAAAAWRSSDRWRPRSARRCGSRRRDG